MTAERREEAGGKRRRGKTVSSRTEGGAPQTGGAVGRGSLSIEEEG